MLPNRRTLLLSSAALGGLVALGVNSAALPGAGPGLKLLSDAEARLILALGEAFFPPGNALGVSADDAELDVLVDELLAEELDDKLPPLFRYLLRGLDAGTFASRGARFATLPLTKHHNIILH